jgi:hypothetical protein
MRFSGLEETGQGGAVTARTLTGILLLQWLAGPNQPEAWALSLFPDVSDVDGEVI